ncbi:MAG: 2-phospho-L-lactate guanylyltransferase [Polyangiaceae bacterium]|jgi:2-phospho-L-lactate/phosphoenolpyruvate guanylyltransferase
MKRPAWAIVPAKSLVHGKSRLRPVLGDEDRALFARRLLEHTLDALNACAVDGVLVAAGDDDVASLAVSRGAYVLRDRGEGSLADVVDRALADVESRGAASAVVLMADLPLIVADDVAGLFAALVDHDIVLVADHVGHHTNALGLAPPSAMPTSFGRADSFAAHLATARAAALRAAVIESERIAFDVDTPADHEQLKTPRRAAGT